MRTGIVIERTGAEAVVLDSGGRFRRVPAGGDWKVGDTVPLKDRAGGRPRWIGAVAACLALVLVLGSAGAYYFTPSAVVSLDVTPSIELTINAMGRVIAAKAYNEEGEDLLGSVGVAHTDYRGAVEALLADQRASYITLTVQGGGGEIAQEVQSAAYAAAAREVIVDCHPVDEDTLAAAHGCGMTAGKYLALQELQQAEPELDVMQYAGCGVDEIREETARCHAQGGQTEHSHGHGHHDG